jgi:2-furoyl-CoA dehydrogenase large subunit
VLALIGAEEPAPPAAMAAAMAAAPAPAVSGGLALQARGHVDIAAPPERVFAVLLDPTALARVIPGCHALQSATGANQLPRRRHRRRRSGEGALRRAHRAQRDRRAAFACGWPADGQSTLGTGSGSGTVRLEATASGTRLHYDYAAQVGGKVAAVGSRMLEGAARIVLAQLFESLGRQAVGGDAAQPAARSFWQRLLHWLGVAK